MKKLGELLNPRKSSREIKADRGLAVNEQVLQLQASLNDRLHAVTEEVLALSKEIRTLEAKKAKNSLIGIMLSTVKQQEIDLPTIAPMQGIPVLTVTKESFWDSTKLSLLTTIPFAKRWKQEKQFRKNTREDEKTAREEFLQNTHVYETNINDYENRALLKLEIAKAQLEAQLSEYKEIVAFIQNKTHILPQVIEDLSNKQQTVITLPFSAVIPRKISSGEITADLDDGDDDDSDVKSVGQHIGAVATLEDLQKVKFEGIFPQLVMTITNSTGSTNRISKNIPSGGTHWSIQYFGPALHGVTSGTIVATSPFVTTGGVITEYDMDDEPADMLPAAFITNQEADAAIAHIVRIKSTQTLYLNTSDVSAAVDTVIGRKTNAAASLDALRKVRTYIEENRAALATPGGRQLLLDFIYRAVQNLGVDAKKLINRFDQGFFKDTQQLVFIGFAALIYGKKEVLNRFLDGDINAYQAYKEIIVIDDPDTKLIEGNGQGMAMLDTGKQREIQADTSVVFSPEGADILPRSIQVGRIYGLEMLSRLLNPIFINGLMKSAEIYQKALEDLGEKTGQAMAGEKLLAVKVVDIYVQALAGALAELGTRAADLSSKQQQVLVDKCIQAVEDQVGKFAPAETLGEDSEAESDSSDE